MTKKRKPQIRPKPIRHKHTKLALVRSWPSDDATILDIKHPAPLFLGEEREDLQCGACGTPIAMGVSASTLRSLFNTPAPLLVRCPKCRSLSGLHFT